MPHLQKLWKRCKDKGLVVIAITAEEGAVVERFVKRRGYDFPVGIDDRRKTSRAYGIRVIPTTFLIGADGKLIWVGNPLRAGDKLDEMVEKALKNVDPEASDRELTATPFEMEVKGEFKGMLRSAASSAGRGYYSAALRSIELVLRRKKLKDEDRAAAESLREQIEAHGRLLLAKGKLLLERKEFLAAEEWLGKIKLRFGRYEPGPTAAELLKERLHSEEGRAELAAERALRAALKKRDAGKRDEFVDALKKLMESHPETAAAEKAEKLLERPPEKPEKKDDSEKKPDGDSGASPRR